MTYGWSGRLDITVHRSGLAVAHHTVHNQITRAGRNLLRDALRGESDTRIKFVALGAGTDLPTDEDLALQDERFRKAVTSQSTLDIGQLLTTLYVSEGEANDFTIEEVGWFAGDATSEAGSGTLIARVLYSKSKTSLETLQLDRTDSIVEA